MVIGKVRSTSIGLTISRSTASTIATIIAETYPSTATPGNTLERITTAKAVNKSLMIKFIVKIIKKPPPKLMEAVFV